MSIYKILQLGLSFKILRRHLPPSLLSNLLIFYDTVALELSATTKNMHLGVLMSQAVKFRLHFYDSEYKINMTSGHQPL